MSIDREQVIAWAREAGMVVVDDEYSLLPFLERFAVLAYAAGAKAERNKLAAWMMAQGFATGHGDTIEDLLKELEWQIEEKQND